MNGRRSSLDPAYRIRMATAADAGIIAHHRVAMFRDMGEVTEHQAPTLIAVSRAHFAAALPAGDYLGWLAEADGEIVAGAGLIPRSLLPRPGYPAGGQEAYVLNVYTEPAHRRRGLAAELMLAILAWCGERGITRVSLHASDDGRRLYERLGFSPTNEMRREADRSR